MEDKANSASEYPTYTQSNVKLETPGRNIDRVQCAIGVDWVI